MKKLSIIVTGLLLATPLTLASAAERFNDRSVHWTSAAPSGSSEPNPPAKAAVDRFNERRTSWVSEAPTVSTSNTEPREPVKVTPRSQSFND